MKGLTFWLAWRYFFTKKQIFSLTTLLSLSGMVVGVASLVASMSVVSGFETTLKNAIIDVIGHVMLIQHGSQAMDSVELMNEIQKIEPTLVATTPFLRVEAVVAHKGKIANILVEGVEASNVEDVISIRKRIISGDFRVTKDKQDSLSPAIIGKGLAKKLDLKVGDNFLIIVPKPSKESARAFIPLKQSFIIKGIVDLGKYEFDQRMVIISKEAAHALAGIEEGITGFRIKLKDENQALQVSEKIAKKLGPQFTSINWFEINRNLFEAIKLEKFVIFFVILIMVIAASFNISSTLFVSVMKRYRDISILKTMGTNQKQIVAFLTFKGLIIGAVGAFIGLGLGIVLGYTFGWLQTKWGLLQADVYKLDYIFVEFRFLDLLLIVISAMVVCLISTIIPALRGAQLSPVEGLRYE